VPVGIVGWVGGADVVTVGVVVETVAVAVVMPGVLAETGVVAAPLGEFSEEQPSETSETSNHAALRAAHPLSSNGKRFTPRVWRLVPKPTTPTHCCALGTPGVTPHSSPEFSFATRASSCQTPLGAIARIAL
jgi:hypothetical protein